MQDSRVVNYDRSIFIRLVTEQDLLFKPPFVTAKGMNVGREFPPLFTFLHHLQRWPSKGFGLGSFFKEERFSFLKGKTLKNDLT